MKFTKKHLISLTLVLFFCFGQILLASPSLLSAATLWEQQEGVQGKNNDIQKAYGISQTDLDGKNDIRVVLARTIKVFFGMLGIIFLVLIVLAGFKYMNARGNEEKTKEALNQIQHAVIGLLIMLAAFSITTFVESSVLQATNDTVYGT